MGDTRVDMSKVDRIDMRGNVLNRKGMYNRCKLTRLVVDPDREKKVWEEAWQTRTISEGEEGGCAESC